MTGGAETLTLPPMDVARPAPETVAAKLATLLGDLDVRQMFGTLSVRGSRRTVEISCHDGVSITLDARARSQHEQIPAGLSYRQIADHIRHVVCAETAKPIGTFGQWAR